MHQIVGILVRRCGRLVASTHNRSDPRAQRPSSSEAGTAATTGEPLRYRPVSENSLAIIEFASTRSRTSGAKSNTSPQRKQVNPRVALFKQVGTRAFATAFTRWRVGRVLSMIDSAFGPFEAGRQHVG
ncbi:MAG TPA: hypothetical protein VMP01_04745 [Pirellulaceae bacterium]|nr:hypothetical protein [Pirellulaceae bacterium]